MSHYSQDQWDNPVDFRIGNTIRLLRIVRGMSQQALAQRLSVTFQQVQKYEKAKTHIAASRLYDIARVLETPIEAFFDSSQTEGTEGAIRDMVDRYDQLSPQFGYHEFVELNRAYVGITRPAVRDALLKLIEQIAPDCPKSPEVRQDAGRKSGPPEPVTPSLSRRPLSEKSAGARSSQATHPSCGHTMEFEPVKVVN